MFDKNGNPVTDMTATTAGRYVYIGTVMFTADHAVYGQQSWLLRASSPAGAQRALVKFSEKSIYADPRIDYVRKYDVKEDGEMLEEEPAEI